MQKIREYKVKVRILGNPDLTVGTIIEHKLYKSLGNQKSRIEVREFEIPKERVEQALAENPKLYVVPSVVGKVKEVLPKKSKTPLQEIIKASKNNKKKND